MIIYGKSKNKHLKLFRPLQQSCKALLPSPASCSAKPSCEVKAVPSGPSGAKIYNRKWLGPFGSGGIWDRAVDIVNRGLTNRLNDYRHFWQQTLPSTSLPRCCCPAPRHSLHLLDLVLVHFVLLLLPLLQLQLHLLGRGWL